MHQFWADLRESVSGTELDFTTGSLSRAILLLSIPMVLEQVMEAIFALVDIFYVSGLGSDAVATVGITESMLTVIYALGGGLATGTTAIIARRIGEKEPEKASLAAVQAILTGILVSLPILFAGIFFSRDFLRIMGASEEVVNTGYRYTSIMLISNVVIMLLYIINAVFRSAGDAAISMRVLIFANLVNIILDPCFIYGWGPFPEMGVQGAAVATTTGRSLAVLFQFYLLFRGKHRIKLKLSHIRVHLHVIATLTRLALGGIGQNIIATLSWLFLVRITAMFGSEVLAGYTIAIRIIIFILLPAWGLANAAATLTGQNLGAGKPERAERSVRITGIVNVLFVGIIAVFLIFNPSLFIKLFIDDQAVIHAGAECLQTIGYGFVFYALGMVLVQAFNGAGDTLTPTKINLVCFWLIEIPLAYILAIPAGMQEKGVYYSIAISESLVTIIAFFLFRQGKWKLRRVE